MEDVSSMKDFKALHAKIPIVKLEFNSRHEKLFKEAVAWAFSFDIKNLRRHILSDNSNTACSFWKLTKDEADMALK